MRKYVIISMAAGCFISTVAFTQPKPFSMDQLQEMMFGVSTLKGVEEVYPQVQIEVLEPTATQLSSTSKIGTLVRNDLQDIVVQALQKAGIKIAKSSGLGTEKMPLSLNITVFIKVAIADPPAYDAFIYTEALQSIKLERDNSIRSVSRTWPMIPMGLSTRNIFMLSPSKLEDTVKEEVSKQVDVFISDFIKANPKPVTRNSEGIDIDALKKTLSMETPELRSTFRVRNENAQLQAIKQLESAGSQEAVEVLLDCLTSDKTDCKLKQNALTALGRIGTEPAIEAIKKFDTWSRKRYTEPQQFKMGRQEYAIDHFQSSDVQPLVQVKDKDNKTWAIIILSRYGGLDLWLTSSLENNVWSEPIFLNLPDFPGLSMSRTERENAIGKLQVEGDVLKIIYNNVTYETRISDQLKDTDKDGLPDIVEARFLTDAKNPDSDGDGVADGKDSNPLTPKQKDANDTMEIRQAVFSALFATSNSRNAIVIVDRGEFAEQEYYGFAGAVLRAPSHREGFVNVTSIDIRYQSKTEATARISDWEGNMAASVHEVKLKKINGKWVVIEFQLTRIS